MEVSIVAQLQLNSIFSLLKSSMKKILILAYDFPPLNSVAAERPLFWMNNFKKNGFYPIVITRAWNSSITSVIEKDDVQNDVEEQYEITDNYTLITIKQKPHFKYILLKKVHLNTIPFFSKILTLFELLTRFRFFLFDDKKIIYHAAKQYLTNNKVDVIMASGEPFLLFKYASLLSAKFNTNWVADYRDGWSTNHKIDKSKLETYIRKRDSISEKRIVNTATLFTTTNIFLEQEIHELTKTKGFVFYNGVDLKELKNLISNTPSSKFIVNYGGTIYDGDYVDIFIEGFKLFQKKYGSNTDFEFEFYGINYSKNEAVEKINKLQSEFSDKIKIYPRVNKETLLDAMKSASIYLDFIFGSPAKGTGTKAFLYMATKKPNIIIPMVKTKESYIFQDRDIRTIVLSGEEFCEVLEKYYLLFREGKSLETSITDDEIYSISRDKSLADFSVYLNQLLDNN
jgi:hypothetical protein